MPKKQATDVELIKALVLGRQTALVPVRATGSTGDSGVDLDGVLFNPMTNLGDIIYGEESGAPARAGIGTEDQVLTVVDIGGDLKPRWADPTGGITITELDDVPDVNAPSPADGDVLTWDSTPGEWVSLAPVPGYTDEQTRDTIGAALVAGNNIDITVSDAGDTITIDVESLTSVDLTDFAEAVDDRVAALLVAGNNIDLTYSDGGNTLTIDVEALTESDIAGLVSDLAALSGTSHAAATVSDTASINLTIAGQLISADVVDSYIQDLISDADVALGPGDLIYGAPGALGPNVALASSGATATAISTASILVAGRVIDASDSTEWGADFATSGDVAGDWIYIDLQTATSIMGWRLYQTDIFQKAATYKVQGSANASSWTDIVTRTVLANDETVEFASIETYRYFRFLAVTGDAFGGGWKIRTIELFSVGVASGTPTALPIGTARQVLKVVDVAGDLLPQWAGLSPLILDEAASPGTPAATTAELRLDAGTNGIQTLTWKSDEAFPYVIGRDEYIIVKNATGSTIGAGAPVYVNGVASGVPTITKAKADDLSTAKVAGVLADSITNNGFGRCFHYGYISTMDTSGFSAGDTLYLHPTTPGTLQNTPPGDLNYNIKIGQVLTSANPGSFLVDIEHFERTIMTTKGDLLTRSSVQNVRQPVGADGEVLKADSATTTGLTWVNVNTLITSTADPSFVALTPPINGNFSWINQGSASVSTTDGGIFLSTPAAAGVNVHLRVMTAPATPYIVTALFITNMPTETSGVNGLFWRQSSDGKLASCVVAGTAGGIPRAQATKYTDPTTFNAVYVSALIPTYHRIWLRIEDNGTNRICYYSYDGLHFQTIHSVGRTDFLTANQIGFAMDANSALYAQQMWLLSWKIT